MRLIAIEEHTVHPGVAAASAARSETMLPHFAQAFAPDDGSPPSAIADKLMDLDEGRLADMDAEGIDMQVLSNLSTQLLPAAIAPELVRDVNDRLAAACRRHPDRFAAFASLPTSAPAAAGDELRRAVQELGLRGAMIHGRTNDAFLSAEPFDVLLKAAADLRVPIYLHPGLPTQATSADNYEQGLKPIVAARFATGAWGWHSETGVHFLNIVLGGVLDRYPTLQFILGHWGEMVPWFLYRLDEALPRRVTGLDRTIVEYVRQNVYYTPSGMFTIEHLRFCADVLGTDRCIFSVDYPFVSGDRARSFLGTCGLPDDAVQAIAHANAERLLGLARESPASSDGSDGALGH
ncbi:MULTISPECIES: amidohydrolase family protein [unclassified Thiocapsa]|uniref:amidohydrolase family protein n=1 Tax=unclassified Thiocapsa TaxID=2641286 RepID=UPI0035B08E7A